MRPSYISLAHQPAHSALSDATCCQVIGALCSISLSLIWRPCWKPEVNAPLACVSAFRAPGAVTATASTFTAATAPSATQRAPAFFLYLLLAVDQVIQPSIQLEASDFLGSFVGRWSASTVIANRYLAHVHLLFIGRTAQVASLLITGRSFMRCPAASRSCFGIG